jgi:hypothetical protein
MALMEGARLSALDYVIYGLRGKQIGIIYSAENPLGGSPENGDPEIW